MGSSKFTHVHVYIIGAVVALIVGAGMFFGLIRPINEENKVIQASIQTTETTSVSVDNRSFNIAQKTQADEALEELKERQQRKASELDVLERRKQLGPRDRLDLGDGTPDHLLTTTLPRWINLPRVVVNTMTDYARRITTRRRGLTSTVSFAAPAPSTDPSTVPRDIVAWELGPMTIRGRFEDVLRWVEDWNEAPLLCSVDGLRMSVADRGGIVEATCSLTVYVFPTGEAVQRVGGAAPGGAMPGGAMPGGAMPGGMPGGMSGGANGPGGMSGGGNMAGGGGMAPGAP